MALYSGDVSPRRAWLMKPRQGFTANGSGWGKLGRQDDTATHVQVWWSSNQRQQVQGRRCRCERQYETSTLRDRNGLGHVHLTVLRCEPPRAAAAALRGNGSRCVIRPMHFPIRRFNIWYRRKLSWRRHWASQVALERRVFYVSFNLVERVNVGTNQSNGLTRAYEEREVRNS